MQRAGSGEGLPEQTTREALLGSLYVDLVSKEYFH